MYPRTQPEVDAERAEAARQAPSISYARLTAATEEQIAVYQRLADQEPQRATKVEYYRSAHGAFSLWRRLISGQAAECDADRLQALVEGVLPT
jgi:hypothetical protein